MQDRSKVRALDAKDTNSQLRSNQKTKLKHKLDTMNNVMQEIEKTYR